MNFEDIFDASFDRVMGATKTGDPFFTSFYDRFLSGSEEVAAVFANTNMPRQRSMLKKSFYSLFVFYASGQSDTYIERIAVIHNQQHMNVRPELYDRWLECLIATVKQYDERFCDEVELAWRLILSPGITYMKFKYDKGG
jgi:hemoglobin-like flavoprotein